MVNVNFEPFPIADYTLIFPFKQLHIYLQIDSPIWFPSGLRNIELGLLDRYIGLNMFLRSS